MVRASWSNANRRDAPGSTIISAQTSHGFIDPLRCSLMLPPISSAGGGVSPPFIQQNILKNHSGEQRGGTWPVSTFVHSACSPIACTVYR